MSRKSRIDTCTVSAFSAGASGPRNLSIVALPAVVCGLSIKGIVYNTNAPQSSDAIARIDRIAFMYSLLANVTPHRIPNPPRVRNTVEAMVRARVQA